MPGTAKENVSINLDINLIEALDGYCCRKELHRSQVIAWALKTYLAIHIVEEPAFISNLYQHLSGNSK